MLSRLQRVARPVLFATLTLASLSALAGQDHRPKFELRPVGSVIVMEGKGAPVPVPVTGDESTSERIEYTRGREALRQVCAEDFRIYGRKGREFLLLEYRDVPRSTQFINGATITDDHTWAHIRSKSTPACEGWVEVSTTPGSVFRAGAELSNQADTCLPELSEKDCPAGYQGEAVCSGSKKQLVCTATSAQRVSDDWRCPLNGAKPRTTSRGQVFCRY